MILQRVEYTADPDRRFKDLGSIAINSRRIVAVVPVMDGDKTVKGACVLIADNDWRATVRGDVHTLHDVLCFPCNPR